MQSKQYPTGTLSVLAPPKRPTQFLRNISAIEAFIIMLAAEVASALWLASAQPLVAGPQSDLSTRCQVQFREYFAYIGFHRPFAYYQQPGHLGVGFALPNQ